ncbi:hypothetical protein VP01_3080g3 [Puccinia sorghi]|uniref:Uncharacterized protein n=1 Tax=Puccinia sorghi TaxID=27349 RepID=A0A0L6V1H6_9BASI|nr:hypothetical protein VP01_3080g3 [Puccinia sorghi]
MAHSRRLPNPKPKKLPKCPPEAIKTGIQKNLRARNPITYGLASRRSRYSPSLLNKSPLVKGQTTATSNLKAGCVLQNKCKGALQKIYINMKFLLDQSGYMGCADSGKPMISKTGNTLNKPHSVVKLAHLLFTCTYATGKNVLLPGVNPTEDTKNYPTTENTSPDKHLSLLKKKKQLVDSSSDEDTVEVIPTHCPPPPKRVQGSKYDIFKSGVESLVGEIREMGSHPKDDIKSTVNKNSMGLPSVLENDANAEVPVSLAETTNQMVCKAWLEDTITKMEQS